MTQLSLLNEPRARATDPSTSRAAAASVQPAAGELEQRILMACGTDYPFTAERIAWLVEKWEPGRWKESTIVVAVSRAAQRGLIVPCGEGLTSRGRTATTYRAAP